MQPILSVIIPTKDQAHALKVCLEHLQKVQGAFDKSHLGQIEVIVVDSSLNDDSQTVCQSFPFARYFCHIDSDPDEARVGGIAQARGKYCAYLGDDDYFIINPLRRMIKFLNDHSEIAITFAPNYLWDDKKKKAIQTTPRFPTNITLNKKSFDHMVDAVSQLLSVPDYYVVRTDLMQKINIHSQYVHKENIWLFHALNFSSVHFFRDVFVRQTRVHHNSARRVSFGDKSYVKKWAYQISETLFLTSIMGRFLTDEGAYKFTDNQLMNVYFFFFILETLIISTLILPEISSAEFDHHAIDSLFTVSFYARYNQLQMTSPGAGIMCEKILKRLPTYNFRYLFMAIYERYHIFKEQTLGMRLDLSPESLYSFDDFGGNFSASKINVVPFLKKQKEKAKNFFYVVEKLDQEKLLLESKVPPKYIFCIENYLPQVFCKN